MERRRALLGSNPSRNSRSETHSDGTGEPIGTGRLPPLRDCQAAIGVDLPIPGKPPCYGAWIAQLGGQFRYVTENLQAISPQSEFVG